MTKMKAMILAAGRGERMRPLTDNTPKPLLPLAGTPMIEHQLHALKQAGIFNVVINVSYLAEKIMAHLGNGSRFGLSIQYSIESPSTLGTGGGVLNALKLLGEDPFLLISADIFCDYPIINLTSHFTNSMAHVVLVDNPIYHPQGDFSLQPNHLVNLDHPKLTYAGIARLHPELFANFKQPIFGLSTILFKAIQNNQLTGEHHQGEWFNLGNPQQLAHLNSLMLKKCAEK